jgi:hypothetical protein
MSCTHYVILPYFSEPEIDRYLKIAEKIESLGKPRVRYEFVLAASPKIEPSARLYERYSRISPSHHYQCPTQIFGYPQGPTAMFWDCMDFLGNQTARDGGFGLWLESDMIPVQPDWLDRLDREWHAQPQNTVLMGCLIPDVYKKRFFRPQRIWVVEHINGGACYSKDFAERVPARYREGTFDMVVYPFLKDRGWCASTDSIALSTELQCRSDIASGQKVLLHGFLQDKDRFIGRCLQPMNSSEQTKLAARPSIWSQSLQQQMKSLKLRFVKRGKAAMLEALLMQQDVQRDKNSKQRFAA